MRLGGRRIRLRQQQVASPANLALFQPRELRQLQQAVIPGCRVARSRPRLFEECGQGDLFFGGEVSVGGLTDLTQREIG